MKKLILITSLIALGFFVSGCQQTPQTPKQPVIDQSLPVLKDIKHLSDITEIGFEWTPSVDERVAGYYVYRSNPSNDNGKLQRIATLKDKYISHYVDTKLIPQTQYHYRFSLFSQDGRESIPSDVVNASTAPLIESVSFFKAISGLPHRVKLIWRPHPSQRVQSYIIQRSEFSSTDWQDLAVVDGRLNAEYIDSGLEDNHVYKYRIKVKTYDGLISKASEIIEAGTKPLPKPVEDLKATNNVPKQISLTWTPSNAKDFSYYKVYRALNPLLFYTYRAKTVEPKFDDLINGNGKEYYYKVTAVDKDGLESQRQDNAVLGSTLIAPQKPVVLSANEDGRSIYLAWDSEDNRAVRYNIVKKFQSKKQVITGIGAKQYTDQDVVPGVEYTYTIIALDQFGLASDESENAIVEIPKD